MVFRLINMEAALEAAAVQSSSDNEEESSRSGWANTMRLTTHVDSCDGVLICLSCLCCFSSRQLNWPWLLTLTQSHCFNESPRLICTVICVCIFHTHWYFSLHCKKKKTYECETNKVSRSYQNFQFNSIWKMLLSKTSLHAQLKSIVSKRSRNISEANILDLENRESLWR